MARGKKKAVGAAGPVEGPWDLPHGWRWEWLSTVTDEFFSGRRPKGGVSGILQGPLSLGGEHLNWDGTLNLTNPKRIPPSFASTISPFAVNEGDILIVKDGATTGKSAFVTALPELAYINEHLFALRPTDAIDRRLLFFWLWSQFGFDQIMKDFRGAAQGGIGRTFVDKVVVPVPRDTEQAGLVRRIDELFSEIDIGEAALADARSGVEAYRHSLLKAAVTGELTADWRRDNPPQQTGEQLLEQLLNDVEVTRKTGNAKRRSKLQPVEFAPDVQDLMWAIPSHWQWVPLGSIAFVTKLAGFEYTKYVQYADDGDLPVIKAENAGLHGFKPTNYSRVHSGAVEQLTRSRLTGGELLMVFVGAGTGNVATVPNNEEYFLGPNIAMMRLETANVEPRYVELFLRSLGGKSLAMAFAKAVAQPSLSMGTIRQIPIAIPPISEQREALSRLEQAIRRGEDAGQLVTGVQTNADTLRQSILAAAFRGDLTQ